MAAFVLQALAAGQFADLFEMDDAALAVRQVRRVVADRPDAFPCRVSLEDAQVGEELLLLPYVHQPADSPYRASGPIFVRRVARTAAPAPGDVPDAIVRRLMSLRAYDSNHCIIAGEVCEGRDVAMWLHERFDMPDVAYVHLHHARYGCYACRADRA